MNTAALIEQERQDDLRRATRTVAKRVEKCIEVDCGIFVHFKLLPFIEIIYIIDKCHNISHFSFLHTFCEAFYA